MNGFRQVLGREHEPLPPLDAGEHGGVAVAHETHGVVLRQEIAVSHAHPDRKANRHRSSDYAHHEVPMVWFGS
jgi:hypothetical protein